MPENENSSKTVRLGSEIVYGAIAVLEAAYGKSASQVTSLQHQLTKAAEGSKGVPYGYAWHELSQVSRAALSSLKSELESGFSGSLRRELAAEVLADFMLLAKTCLDQGDEGSKNVASVLAAAAFEDVIRRMGAEFAGVTDRVDLSDVLQALKKTGIIHTPQISVAQSYLPFRNHALHAEWQKIERETIYSVLGFVEQLLMKHFA